MQEEKRVVKVVVLVDVEAWSIGPVGLSRTTEPRDVIAVVQVSETVKLHISCTMVGDTRSTHLNAYPADAKTPWLARYT
jgi:hypothetical protein